MQVLSKMSNIQMEDELCTNWIKYYATNPSLMKYRHSDLKSMCKKLRLKVTGNKTVLTERITEKFKHDKCACDIQKHARRLFIKKYIEYRGPAVYDKKCTNDTDFLTLEPINTLHIKDFFSFKDSDGFIFGFDYDSIYNLIKRDRSPKNPYNRSELSKSLIRKIKRLRRMNRVLYPKSSIVENTLLQTTNNVVEPDPVQTHLFRELEDRRVNKTFIQRTEAFFYDIDLLGNYTSSVWFNQLTTVELSDFIRFLYQMWMYRARISYATKNNICPYYNPFTYNGVGNQLTITPTITRIRNVAITICENMLYTAINDEYKKLSAIYILTSLTTVSRDARNSIPWLYESTL